MSGAGLETNERVRINCERYRNSPPICSSKTLTDSQKRAAEALEDQRREREQAMERERKYRWVRRMAIIWTVMAAIGVGLIAAFVAIDQLLLAAIMLQPVCTSVLDALRSIHEWRHFDD